MSNRASEAAWSMKVSQPSPGLFSALASHPDGRARARTGPDEVLLKREMQQEMAQMDAAHATLEPLLAPIDNAPIIQVRQLTKTFHVGEVDVHALQGIDLQVARGEFLSIIGTSGSGKSTLFNILGGLTPPSTGSVEINGRNLSQMNDTERNDLRKRTVGFVFQKYNLLPTLTAEQNIQIVRDVAGRPTAFDEHFKEILAMLGIENACSTSRARFRVASSSVWRLPVRLSTGRPSCSPTSPPAISTARTRTSC